jgi:hypothetical protein
MWDFLFARLEPCERAIFFLVFKMLNLRPNEMIGNARHDLQKPTVCDGSDAFNLAMVISYEFKVCHKCAEVLPTGERLRVDHEANEFSLRGDEGIDLFRELLEIRLLERATWSNEKDASVPQQFKINHRIYP